MAGDDYEVGYGRTPKHTRWPKGVSGNPKGRKKGTRGLKTDLDAELREILTIQMNGKKVKGTTQRLMLRTLAVRAASGDVRASRILIELILQVFGIEDRGGKGEQLSSIDRALLEDLLHSGTESENGASDGKPPS